MYSYIHIPFCQSKCKYCRFASVGSIQKLKIFNYINYLVSEIEREDRDIPDKKLKSVYFGGGTPSLLSSQQLKHILSSLKTKFGFSDDIEVTLETTPSKIKKSSLRHREELGINRISVGIQTFNRESLKEVGRDYKLDMLGKLELLSKSSIKNISLDFIIGLPHVKLGGLKNDIEFVLETFPFIKHISVYMMEDYYDLEKSDKIKYEKILYPNYWKSLGIKESEYLEEYIEIKKVLQKHGFNRYEISNYAKEGYECKHNMAYREHKDVVAYGLSASGFINGERYTSSSEFPKYYNKENVFIEKLSKDDIFLETVMFGLRTEGLSKDIYTKLNTRKIDYLVEEGLLGFDDETLILKDKGVTLLDYIIKEIY